MKKVFVVASVTLVVFLLWFFFVPSLLKSPDRIRSDILKHLPLKSSIEKTEDFLQKKKWRIDYVSKATGYSHPKNDSTVGKQSIRAHAGHYRFLLRVDVIVFFGFDHEGRLIDIHVKKYKDGT